MAKLNYEHVYAAAGFSGESWDITQGYNQTYAAPTTAATFTSGTKTISLASGSFPAWFVAGKVFYTDSLLNPGPFTVKQRVSGSSVIIFETVVAEASVTVTFDGAGDTKIQDVLLKEGNGVLTTDAPLVLVSSGALNAPRTLDISDLEAESIDQGGQPLNGRFLFVSIENSDILTNSITISSSATINGQASITITSSGDFLFYHIANGVWRCAILPLPAEKLATMARIPFSDYKWDEGTTKNTIVVTQSTTPSLGEVGPHNLLQSGSYIVQVINTDLTPDELVDVEVQFDSSGNITLKKAAKGADFNGVVLIVGSLE